MGLTQEHDYKTEVVVASLVPKIQASIIESLGWPSSTDMSREPKCHIVTFDLLEALLKQELPARRELHTMSVVGRPDNIWHYIIAHADEDDPPTEQDLITDVNPWQFDRSGIYTGYLHDTREKVRAMLTRAEAPEPIVALRGIQTIILPHTERMTPPPHLNLSLTG